MAKQHNYTIDLVWTGNVGVGTENYTSYERSHTLRADHKPDLLGSSDPMFRGDKSKWNPEELLLASLFVGLYDHTVAERLKWKFFRHDVFLLRLLIARV